MPGVQPLRWIWDHAMESHPAWLANLGIVVLAMLAPTVELRAGDSLSGRVTTLDGEPVSGALVIASVFTTGAGPPVNRPASISLVKTETGRAGDG